MKYSLFLFILCLLFSLVSPLSGQRTEKNSIYPEFSWNTVPVYLHFGKNDGLTDEEIYFVAKHSNFVCLEKGHGQNPHGSTEDGIEFDGQRLKSINPDLKLIYYWNTFLDYSMYDAHDVYAEHPEWWLRKLDGSLDLKNGSIMRYDLSNSEVREWWSEEVRKAVIDGVCDGVFMDAFPQITSANNISLWGQEKFDSIQEGLDKLIQLTRQKTDSSAIIQYNGIRNTDDVHFGMDYIDATDAATIEHFAAFASTSKESIAQDMEDMITAGKQGKIVIMKGWPGFNWTMSEKMKEPYEDLLEEARENITFPLACFLIAAQPYSYFAYSWGYREGHGMLDWYDEFDRPLGAPLGDAVRNNWEYTREFEHVNVWVNLETKEAEIEWKDYTPPAEQSDSTILESSPYEGLDSLLFSFVPKCQSTRIPEFSGNTLFTTEYQPSGSEWHEQCNEKDVFMARLTHKMEPDSMLWDLRISRAGAIYSFIGPYGEGVPPQYRSWDFNTARWVDDVWQTVALSLEKHNSDEIPAPPGSTLGRPQIPGMRYFIHGAGVYMNDTMFARTNKPFYSPLMGSWYDEANRAFYTMNWGQQAHTPNIHKSQLLYTHKYKDLGSGILETTYIIQNFGNHKVDYVNMPWGGVRAANLPQCWLSNPNDSLERTYKPFAGEDPGLIDDIDKSGGYFIWAAEGNDENRPAMAIVYGKDIHYNEYNQAYNMNPTRIRWGDGSDDLNRSYSVFTVNQRLDINPGSTFYYRVFFINGTMKEVHEKARDLVTASDYGFIISDPSKSPMTIIKKESLENALTDDIKLFASPVENMVPLFLMEDTMTGKRYISPDLYHNVLTLPFANPYDPADPKYENYQDQFVYRPYAGNIKYIRLLGYGINQSQIPPHFRYVLLDSLIKDTSSVILTDDYKNAIWIPAESCDSCNPVPVKNPDEGFMLYNDFGTEQTIDWTQPINLTFNDMEANPDISEINSSTLTGKVVRKDGKWANLHFNLPGKPDFESYSSFKIKAYYESSEPISDVCNIRMILRKDGNGKTQYTIVNPVLIANQWVEYIFNVDAGDLRDDYNQVWLFFSSPDDNNITVGHTYYIDDLMGPPLSSIPKKYNITFSVRNNDSEEMVPEIPISIEYRTLTTNLAGEASIMLSEGSHNYSISETGYYPVDSSLNLESDTIIHIDLVEAIAQLKFSIRSDNEPVSLATVDIDGTRLQTDTAGIAVFEDLPMYTDYSYTITMDGYESENGIVTLKSDTIIYIDLETTTAQLKFSIRSDNEPVSLATVDINGTRLQTDTAGIVVFEDLPMYTDYSYSITMDGYESENGIVTLKSDTIIYIDLETTTAQLKFSIRSDNEPVSLATVDIDGTRLQTDTAGIVVFEDLPMYTDYSYSITMDGYESENGIVTLKSDTTININLELIISIKNSNTGYIMVYPNPVNSMLFLASDEPIKKMDLLNIQGRLVQRYQIKGQSAAIDISDHQNAIYFIKIFPENGIPVIKRIILLK